jgi:drug/metabolite transporter (DMT)-like permease
VDQIRILTLTTLAMIAFAGNSLLCRLALKTTGIDAASFTSIRLISGALTLYVIVLLKSGKTIIGGNWLSAFALFAYAAGFSFAYINLSAATGALLLFSAVQTSMITYGLYTGERLRAWQMIGFALALTGLLILLMPGLYAPPLSSSLLMISAGIAWGLYSLRGKVASDASAMTAGNFLRAIPFALALSLLMLTKASLDTAGIAYAIASGAVASGIGYAIWYTALPSLKSTSAASVQLSVPAIAAVGGILFLDETASLRLVFASICILGGIALVTMQKNTKTSL